MKLLYLNGTFEGGSLLSTRELLAWLPEDEVDARLVRAHEESADVAYVRRRMTNLAVKLGGAEPDNLVEQANRLWGRRPKHVGAVEWSSIAVENTGKNLLGSWKPDVVVVSSVDRVAWRRIRQDTKAAGAPCVLYLREEALLPHLDLTDAPDLVLANSRGIVDSCQALGWEATLVPSVIDLSACTVESERTKALLINPTRPYGLELTLKLAEACPGIDFVLQESTRSTPEELDLAMSAAERLANVEYRPFASNPADIYRDARVLLAPYTHMLESNRPRSVLEAHWNGIPVVGTDRAGLCDAVGPGGVLLPVNATVEQWSAELRSLFASGTTYDNLVAKAHDYARRPEVDPNSIAQTFTDVIQQIATRRHRSS